MLTVSQTHIHVKKKQESGISPPPIRRTNPSPDFLGVVVVVVFCVRRLCICISSSSTLGASSVVVLEQLWMVPQTLTIEETAVAVNEPSRLWCTPHFERSAELTSWSNQSICNSHPWQIAIKGGINGLTKAGKLWRKSVFMECRAGRHDCN